MMDSSTRAIRPWLPAVAILVALVLSASSSSAATIRSAVSASVIVGGEFDACCDIGNAIDQSGLSLGYTSGVTDFDVYLGANPLHDPDFQDQEYFSLAGTATGVVEFDLGAIYAVDRVALWNEEGAGISLMDVLLSTDGFSFTEVVSNFAPSDNPDGLSYPAEAIPLGGTFNARYLRIDMNTCPSDFEFCSIGEVAFSTATAVPETGTGLLLGLGLTGAGIARRRHLG